MLVRMWRKGNPFPDDGNVNLCSHCGKQHGGFSKKKKKLELPLMQQFHSWVYRKKMKTLIQKDTALQCS